jgi:hypothetical protein
MPRRRTKYGLTHCTKSNNLCENSLVLFSATKFVAMILMNVVNPSYNVVQNLKKAANGRFRASENMRFKRLAHSEEMISTAVSLRKIKGITFKM